MNLILWMLIVALTINLAMFIPAYIYKTDKLTDISYALTFIVLAVFGSIKSHKTVAQIAVFIFIILWAIRLGGYLFVRINKIKKDVRFDDIRGSFLKFLRFWLLQAVTVFIILIPSILLWQQKTTNIGWLSILGTATFALGLIIETIADTQKYRFNNRKKFNQWIDEGIWRASRHPNYLGEILVWLGVYAFIAPSLSTSNKLVAIIGPLFITLLLIFVSGIPLLEKSADKKWGLNKKYQQYKSNVPVLVPSYSSVKRIFIKAKIN